MVENEKSAKLGAGVSGLIWTTTPWTLPANRALAFHPEFEYVVADTPAGKLLLAKERLRALAEESKVEVGEFYRLVDRQRARRHPVPASVSGFDKCRPCSPTTSRSISGSGIVHTAPGHGADDFRTGEKYGLEAYAPIDDEGRFIEGLPEYKDKTVFEANADRSSSC